MKEGRPAARGQWALALLAASLALVGLGQFYFRRRPDYLWDGVAFCALGALCFLLAWRASRPKSTKSLSGTAQAQQSAARRLVLSLLSWLRRHPLPAALMAFGLFLSALAALLARERPWNRSTYDLVILWLAGMGFVVAAVWALAARPVPGSGGRRVPWTEVGAVAGLTALALLLRVTALSRVPYTLGGDEAWHGLLARQVLASELRNPFVMGTMSMPTLFYWPLSWSLRLVGDPLVGLRLPAALAGALTIPAFYLLVRSLWGRRLALVAAALLAAYDYHIHYSRLGANNVWDPLLVVLTLWLVDRGLVACLPSLACRLRLWHRHGRPGQAAVHASTGATADGRRQAWCFLLAGLVMGLGACFYTGARLLPAMVALYVGFFWLQNRWPALRRPGGRAPAAPDAALWPYLLLMALAFLAAAGPMLGYAQAHPAEWNARLNQVGIVQSGWLAREPGLTGKTTAHILAEQFLRAAGAFHVFPDRTVWYGSPRPLLGVGAGALAIIGMATALGAVVFARQRRYFLVLLWFWSVIVTGGMLTESPPSSQRLVMAIPAVVLLVATGLDRAVALAGRLLGVRRLWRDLALGLLTLALMVGSVRFYFVEFAPSARYGGENGETATMIGHYLAGLDGDHRAYFLGAPRIYWGFGSMSFLAPAVPGRDVVDPLEAPPEADTQHATVWIFLPEREGELLWVRQAFPQGRLREFRDAGGRLRFIAYEVPPAP